MKFELNEYHGDISNEELLNDLKYVAAKLNKTSITTSEYRKIGRFNEGTFRRRFGSWIKSLELAGLIAEKKQINNILADDEELLQDLRRVANNIGKDTVTTGDYKIYGKYDRTTILKHFGTWSKALDLAKLQTTGFNKEITNEDLFMDIENTWISLGRQPTTTDIKNNVSTYSLNTFSRRFGSWRKALEAFVIFINQDVDTSNNNHKVEEQNDDHIEVNIERKNTIHKTNRDVNYRLRFIVMRRDNFKCCICGAAPSNDSSVILHVDHIVPWSKGGETVESNLQTLCSRCNLGKSDLDIST